MNVGDRIKMTQAALSQNLDGIRSKIKTGVFLGPAKQRYCIRVRRDGHKQIEVYNRIFWEPE